LLVLVALINGVFDMVPLNKVTKAETLIRQKSTQLSDDLLRRIFSSEPLNDNDETVLISLAKEAIANLPELKSNE